LKKYTLRFVSEHFLNDTKEDLRPDEIWEYQLIDAAHRKQIATYCVKDTLLPLQLLLLLCTVPNLVEFARVTNVPMGLIYSRGQQIKTLALITQAAHAKGILITLPPRGPLLAPLRASDPRLDDRHWDYYGRRPPPLANGKKQKGYEGAVVIEPQSGAYYEPVSTLDYKSLYPSIMRGWRLCFMSLVLERRFLGLPGVKYRRVQLTQKGRAPMRIWWVTNCPVILPEILAYLLGARGRAKKLLWAAEQAGDKAMAQVYDGRQLALKVIANSVYGFTGADEKGVLPVLSVAAFVTFYGRWMITETSALVMRTYPPAKIIYGDSVTGDTPVLLRIDGIIAYACIESLFQENLSQQTLEKESHKLQGVEVWSDAGWTSGRNQP
jgi:DNA polymerase delta subunit 1